MVSWLLNYGWSIFPEAGKSDAKSFINILQYGRIKKPFSIYGNFV